MSERQSKAVQERHERMLNEIVKRPENELCADCGARNPRWASYSLGVFLCIRCAGIHRKMGTHISKVKSITMDQWTMEQIEMMRNSGGNTAANQKINPYDHPVPITQEDDHAIERYIRAKWEKRAFLVDNTVRQALASPSPSSPTSLQHSLQKASPAVARLQVLPKRSSSVPVISSASDNLANLQFKMLQLYEMGYKDEHKNRQILAQTQGNVEAAMEILARPAQHFQTQQPQIQQQQPTQVTSDEQKLEHLMKLGFMDRQQNADALRRAGGNIDVAITIVNEAKKAAALAGQSISSEQQLSNRSMSMSSLHNNNSTTSLSSTPNPSAHNPFASSQSLSAFSTPAPSQQRQQIDFSSPVPALPSSQQTVFSAPSQQPQHTAFSAPLQQQQQQQFAQTQANLSPFQQSIQTQNSFSPFQQPSQTQNALSPFQQPNQSQTNFSPFQQPNQAQNNLSPFQVQAQPQQIFQQPTQTQASLSPFQQLGQTQNNLSPFQQPSQTQNTLSPFQQPSQTQNTLSPFQQSSQAQTNSSPFQQPFQVQAQPQQQLFQQSVFSQPQPQSQQLFQQSVFPQPSQLMFNNPFSLSTPTAFSGK